MDAFPEEILHSILSLFFRSISQISSFTDLNQSKPFVDSTKLLPLLVCRTWLRVGTPLAYETVILHTAEQVQALVAAFKRRHQAGLHVRNLMLLGGFGKYTSMILGCTPHLRRLRLTIYLAAEDRVSGLVRSLSLVNPDEVIIYQHARPDNRLRFHIHNSGPTPRIPDRKNVKELVNAVATCIKKSWSNLRIFHAAFHALRQPSVSTIAVALAGCATLITVRVAGSSQQRRFLLTVLENPSLRRVIVVNASQGFMRAAQQNERLMSLLHAGTGVAYCFLG
ncbi:hypothetical protein B0H11DRAFT_1919804 [Mycena galericulata]|nr:hypothetical protein B0H11DRAFT_1919804 [Mycena galericulata]